MVNRPLKDSNLRFEEEEHRYTVGEQELVSVTTWVKKHFPKFDPDAKRWDGKTYAQGTASYVRAEIKGEGPVTRKNEDPYHYCKRLFRDSWEEEVEARKGKKVPINAREVKKLWEQNGREAAERGTRIHKLIEEFFLGEVDLVDISEEVEVLKAVNEVQQLLNKQGYPTIHPEVKIYSLDYGLAGTVDLLLDCSGGLVLVDYKTNSELKWKGYGKGTTEATQHLSDANMILYTLQLSTYAYILETEYKRNIHGLWVYHVTSEGTEPIEIDYMRSVVEAMLQEEKKYE